MDLKKMLENTVKKYADKAAIVIGERRVSFSELDEASNRIANTLIEMGLQKGDRVITAGGIYGTIESLSEDSIVLKVESGATIRVARGSVIGRREK